MCLCKQAWNESQFHNDPHAHWSKLPTYCIASVLSELRSVTMIQSTAGMRKFFSWSDMCIDIVNVIWKLSRTVWIVHLRVDKIIHNAQTAGALDTDITGWMCALMLYALNFDTVYL